MEYLSLRQTAEKWGISIRRVQTLCSTDRIPGATKIGSYYSSFGLSELGQDFIQRKQKLEEKMAKG